MLTKTEDAKQKTDDAKIDDQIRLAVEASIANNKYKVDKDVLKDELKKEGIELEGNSTNGPWKVNTQDTTYTIKNNGEVTKKEKTTLDDNIEEQEEVATKIPESDYGAIVTNYEVPNEDFRDADIQWRIFLEDGNNIYLIASDYIQLTKVPSKGEIKLGIGPSGYSKSVSLDNILSEYSGASDIVENKKISKKYNEWVNLEDHKTSENENIKAIAYILDTDVWSVYANDKAKYAIGGPTLEMFCESYKKTHVDKYIEYDINNDNGYKVKWSTEGEFKGSISGVSGKDLNGLYILSDMEDAWAYYLASPYNNTTAKHIYQGYSIGYVGWNSYVAGYMGFRPIVCLNSNVKLQKIEEGKYEIIGE